MCILDFKMYQICANYANDHFIVCKEWCSWAWFHYWTPNPYENLRIYLIQYSSWLKSVREMTLFWNHPPLIAISQTNLREIARATSSLSAQLKRNTPGVPNSVKNLCRQIKIVLLAVLFNMIGWQDQDLWRGLLRGFQVAADLSQQQNNIFHPNASEKIFNQAE